MGKIIVIEGTDSSGKQTQSEILYENFKKVIEEREALVMEGKEGTGIEVKIDKYLKKISFPNYESPACAPVKMYLAGEFGSEPGKINPYPISTMYAIDRYASYKTSWGDFYEKGGIIITDRYTTSNMVHQASKIDDEKERVEYLNWLEDLEYDKIGIPRPDMVIFLNMPTESALKLMVERKNKITGEEKKDIHESDAEYLKKSHKTACEVAKLQGWQEIMCTDGDRIKTIEEIAAEIMEKAKEIV